MTSIKVNNPFDQSLIQELPETSEREAMEAMDKAFELSTNRQKWLPAYERVEILERVVDIMSAQVEELTQLAASEGGKPYMDSKVEVLRAINGVKLAIEHIPAIKGEQIPMGHTASSATHVAHWMTVSAFQTRTSKQKPRSSMRDSFLETTVYFAR